jgi:hypothetical protein
MFFWYVSVHGEKPAFLYHFEAFGPEQAQIFAPVPAAPQVQAGQRLLRSPPPSLSSSDAKDSHWHRIAKYSICLWRQFEIRRVLGFDG